MSNLFEATDPRGHIVCCTVECWAQHILKKHIWMKNRKDDVISAIQSPLAIYQDTDFGERQNYYFLPNNESYYVKVVVDFEEGESGKVITAFPVDSTKPGEELIWPKSNR